MKTGKHSGKPNLGMYFYSRDEAIRVVRNLYGTEYTVRAGRLHSQTYNIWCPVRRSPGFAYPTEKGEK